mmetsp:Transcript_7749/g.13067  ORF Transcript_7749/g.13067 Transcript_7749/m.13067 type:complete len:122 (+) Transcript_7749:2932-3297(+)
MPSGNGRRSREDFDEDDEEERIQYGIRRARREVSWEYRDSSSLAPVQVMEQEMYHYTAESMLQMGVVLGHVLALLSTIHQYYKATLLRWANRVRVDEYLPLNEVLPPPPAVDLGDVWDFNA